MSDPLELWRHWFEELDRERWFRPDAAVDVEVARRFGGLPDQALAGELDGWRRTARGTLALVLATDQLPRNLFRGTARAFAYDARARDDARRALARGLPAKLGRDERLFLYLPFEHSEDLADQDLACRLIGALGDPVYTDYAERHRQVIRRFGRFPHRNALLGRATTAEEAAFLDAHGGF